MSHGVIVKCATYAEIRRVMYKLVTDYSVEKYVFKHGISELMSLAHIVPVGRLKIYYPKGVGYIYWKT